MNAVGIFTSRDAAIKAVQRLVQEAVPADKINFLSPCTPDDELAEVPRADEEGTGMGKAMGTYLGGVLGAAGGFTLGSGISALALTGVGTILLAGFGAAALIGFGGMVAGDVVGGAFDKATDQGIPKDDFLTYRQLLKWGHTIVVVTSDVDEEIEKARRVLKDAGGLGIDDMEKLRPAA